MERFIKIIQENSKVKGIKWDNLVLRFEWSFEADKIEEYLTSEQTAYVKENVKTYIRNAITNFKTRFDFITIKSLVKEIVLHEKPDIEFLLQNHIRLSADRIKEYNNIRIRSLHQSNTNDADFKLHEGFDKICGLKGSLLSGGQK